MPKKGKNPSHSHRQQRTFRHEDAWADKGREQSSDSVSDEENEQVGMFG